MLLRITNIHQRKKVIKLIINSTVNDNVCVLTVEGGIDTNTAPQLEQAFRDNAENCEKMIFDLSKVDYISSAGLRVIVVAHREMEKKNGLILKSLSKNVKSVIDLTGFNKALNIEE